MPAICGAIRRQVRIRELWTSKAQRYDLSPSLILIVRVYLLDELPGTAGPLVFLRARFIKHGADVKQSRKDVVGIIIERIRDGVGHYVVGRRSIRDPNVQGFPL